MDGRIVEMIEVDVPVVRCPTCDLAYALIAPLMPARWIYEQPRPCKRSKHALAEQRGVDMRAVETLPLKAIRVLTDETSVSS